MKFLIAIALALCSTVAVANAQQKVPITDIAARSRVAVGISRVWESEQFGNFHDEAIVTYNFKIVPHLYLASSLSYDLSGNGVAGNSDNRWRPVLGLRIPIGAGK